MAHCSILVEFLLGLRSKAGSKSGAETEGKDIQRLSHLGTHPICSHQTQTLLLILRRVCL
ncbi:mCG147263 [Mus musculus]|nr:mCG147263 [Mus musculus]